MWDTSRNQLYFLLFIGFLLSPILKVGPFALEWNQWAIQLFSALPPLFSHFQMNFQPWPLASGDPFHFWRQHFFFFFPRWSFEMRESLEIPALWNYIAFPIPPSSCTVAKDHAPYLIKYIISNFLFCLSLWTYSCLHTTSSCQIAVAFLLYFKWTSLRDLVLVVSLFQEWSLKTFHGEFHLF